MTRPTCMEFGQNWAPFSMAARIWRISERHLIGRVIDGRIRTRQTINGIELFELPWTPPDDR